MSQKYNLKAFTLIELLIATLIFSIIILTIYSAFQTGILTYRKTDSAFETYQTARIALNRIELDLKNAFAYKADDPQFQGSAIAMEFFSIIDSYREDKLNTDTCRIKYEWNENDKILKRACYTGLAALETQTGEESEDLAFNVGRFVFEYAWPTGEKENPYTWEQAWPKADNSAKTLPLAVKIKLSLNAIEFTKIVSLPLGKIPHD